MNKSATGGAGHTPFTLASGNGHVEAARLLLEAGAEVNKRTSGGAGDTPLTFASWNGKVEAVRVLLEAGADVNQRTSEGRTPLFLALKIVYWHTEQQRQDKPKIAALLHEFGALDPTALELAEMEQEIAQENAGLEEWSEEDYSS